MSAARKAAATGPLVTVDVGNTDTVVGRFLGPDLDESWRVTSSRTTTDEVRLQLEQMLRTGAAGCPSVLCSVVPHQTRAWAEALHAITGRDTPQARPSAAVTISPTRHNAMAVATTTS